MMDLKQPIEAKGITFIGSGTSWYGRCLDVLVSKDGQEFGFHVWGAADLGPEAITVEIANRVENGIPDNVIGICPVPEDYVPVGVR